MVDIFVLLWFDQRESLCVRAAMRILRGYIWAPNQVRDRAANVLLSGYKC